MKKQQIHANIDATVYLALKHQEINISGLINELLKLHVDSEDVQSSEVLKLSRDLEKYQAEVKLSETKIERIVVLLTKAKAKEKQEAEETERRKRAMGEAVRRSNPLRRMV